jgi:hypothetical protein
LRIAPELALLRGEVSWRSQVVARAGSQVAWAACNRQAAVTVQLVSGLEDMSVPRAARPRARTAAVLVVAVAAGLAAVGCGPTPPGGRVPAGLVATHLGPPVTGPPSARIVRFRWSRLPASPLGPRSEPLLAWDGTELLELGGLKNGATTYGGAAFDPATRRWHLIASPGPRNVGFSNAVSAWTGRQLFVANGQSESCVAARAGGGTPPRCVPPQAGLYDPAANRWSAARLPQPMDGLAMAAAVWTGRDVVLAGVNASRGRLGVAAFDPVTGRWQMITPVLPAGHPPRLAAMVATAGRLIVWSLWDRVTPSGNGFADYAGVDVLALSSDGTWRDVTGRWPQNRQVTAPVFTGRAILVSPGQVWCGTACSPPYSSEPGYFADPATLARTVIPPGPLGMADPAFVWAGHAIIAVDLDASIGAHAGQGALRPDDMALWNPAARQWLRLPAPPGYPRLAATGGFIPASEATPQATPVWTGTELLALTATGHLLALNH